MPLVTTVGGITRVKAASFTRPANTTAYAEGDLVANHGTAGSVEPLVFGIARQNGGTGVVRNVRIRKSGTGTTDASFRVHLYTSEPTVEGGDNATWSSDLAGYLGSVDVTVDKAFSDGAAGVASADIVFDLVEGSALYGLLEARAAYTPVSEETFAVELAAFLD